ncbi:MAG: hypothetical protein ACFFD4_02550 [Candidatus Odinarchaeota archaeon]
MALNRSHPAPSSPRPGPGRKKNPLKGKRKPDRLEKNGKKKKERRKQQEKKRKNGKGGGGVSGPPVMTGDGLAREKKHQ